MTDIIELKNNYIKENNNKLLNYDLDVLDYKEDYPFNIRECVNCENLFYQIDMIKVNDNWICKDCFNNLDFVA